MGMEYQDQYDEPNSDDMTHTHTHAYVPHTSDAQDCGEPYRPCDSFLNELFQKPALELA